MGISDKFHFQWQQDVVRPLYEDMRSKLPENPMVLGLAERGPSLLIEELFHDVPFQYRACDLFLEDTPGAYRHDLNDLSDLSNVLTADLVTCFRASVFLESKWRFLRELRALLNPGAYVLIDFLTGSSDLPVLDFRYGGRAAAAIYDVQRPSVFRTTFYDDMLLMPEHIGEVEAFCRHARRWPTKTILRYIKAHPREFLRTIGNLKGLAPHNLGEAILQYHDEDNVVSLKDLEDNGFTIEKFDTHYFYPEVGKFNLFSLVVAKYEGYSV